MTNAKRGRGSRQGIYCCAIAALGLALSACGGGSGSSSIPAPTAQSSTPPQVPSSASTSSSTPASSTTPAPGLPGGSPPTATAGTVTLNWMPPTQNVDGSALTNLSGYDIHYGSRSGNYTQTIPVSNPGLATFVVSDLTPGTYYFAVAAVNSTGTESPLSAEVSATVD